MVSLNRKLTNSVHVLSVEFFKKKFLVGMSQVSCKIPNDPSFILPDYEVTLCNGLEYPSLGHLSFG